MISIGKVIPPISPGLGSLHVLLVLLKRSLRVLPQSSKSSKAGECFHASGGVSVSTLRKEFKKFIELFVDDISKYGMHSMRSGAASNPACSRIPGDLLDMHAGWRCPSSKNRYIKHTGVGYRSIEAFKCYYGSLLTPSFRRSTASSGMMIIPDDHHTIKDRLTVSKTLLL